MRRVYDPERYHPVPSGYLPTWTPDASTRVSLDTPFKFVVSVKILIWITMGKLHRKDSELLVVVVYRKDSELFVIGVSFILSLLFCSLLLLLFCFDQNVDILAL